MDKTETSVKKAISLAIGLKSEIIQGGFNRQPVSSSVVIDRLNKIVDALNGWPVMDLTPPASPDCSQCAVLKEVEGHRRFAQHLNEVLNTGSGVYKP